MAIGDNLGLQCERCSPKLYPRMSRTSTQRTRSQEVEHCRECFCGNHVTSPVLPLYPFILFHRSHGAWSTSCGLSIPGLCGEKPTSRRYSITTWIQIPEPYPEFLFASIWLDHHGIPVMAAPLPAYFLYAGWPCLSCSHSPSCYQPRQGGPVR